MGFELVDLTRAGTRTRPILRLRVDRTDSEPGRGITIDECGAISRSLEAWLDDEQPIGPRYVLEVSSPGIERPLRWAEHWRRFRGHTVTVRAPELGGKQQARILETPDDGHVSLELNDGRTVTLALADIDEATLVVDWTKYQKR